MRKFTWLLALAIPVTIISCQKDAVQNQVSNEDAALGQYTTRGNGAPSGPHYNLNIIGVPKEKSASMTNVDGTGGRIFVPLSGKTARINLTEGSTFMVTDANGTDGTAAFTLPNPDPDADGITEYSAFARVPGNPKGAATLMTCADGVMLDSDGDQVLDQEYPILLTCDKITFDEKYNKTFQNVTAELLYVTLLTNVEVNGEIVLRAGRYPIFDERLYGYFWEYDAKGMKLLQIRFYDVSSTVDLYPDENGNYDPTVPTN